MGVIKTFINCMFGPRLCRVYKVTVNGRAIEHKTYIPSNWERWGDRIVVSFATIWSISLYTIPLVAIFMYEPSYSTLGNAYFLGKIVAGASLITITSLAVRGHARYINSVYYKFIQELLNVNERSDKAVKDRLRRYEYDFWAMPLDYVANNRMLPAISLRDSGGEAIAKELQSLSSYLMELPCKLIAYIVAHTIAIKLIYPGSVFIVNWALRSTLEKGRIDLISQGGVRFKLRTSDQNFIDSMFIDRRNITSEGSVLVICCEGNCGFYENGILVTPLKKGYSVLGWNHPGFGDSTGTPYPDQEEHAVDVIMRFAMEHLGFTEENIIIYGWSIGGYTATYAAVNYPKINSLILDATFDHVLPLAYMVTPPYLHRLTRRVILYYFHLCVADYLLRYNGPVLIVRRTEDEIVCAPANTLGGNRANILLLLLFTKRFPYLFPRGTRNIYTLLKVTSAGPSLKRTFLRVINSCATECAYLIGNEIHSKGGMISFPSELGRGADNNTVRCLILYLMSKYFKDQQSTHCVPLSENLFVPAWDPNSTYDMYLAEQKNIRAESTSQQSSGSTISHQTKFESMFHTKSRDKNLESLDASMKLLRARTDAANVLGICSLEGESVEITAVEEISWQGAGIRTRPRVATDQDANSELSNNIYDSDVDTIDLDFLDLETSDEEGSAAKTQIPKTSVSGTNTKKTGANE